MAYDFRLDGMLLPVAPAKLQVKISNQNKTLSLIDESEINILKAPGLTEFSFEFLLPQVLYPFSVYEGGFKSADYFTEKIKSLKVQKKPFVFSVSRVYGRKELFFTNMLVSLEDYTITEDAKEGSDVMVSINLKEYREYGTVTVDLSQDENGNTVAEEKVERQSDRVAVNDYTVVSGDTLWGICQKVLGDGGKYAEIARLNNISNPNLIYPGQVIKFA